jgi:hypothetical protein
VYGQTLASSTLSGGVASVAGTFAFTTPSTASNAGTANQGYTFTPTDTTNYTSVTGTVSVTVAKATPSITTGPTASSIVYGQTLASSTLSGGVASVAGTFAFTTPSTAPNAGTASQGYTFTPTDTTNYAIVMGTVSVRVTNTTKIFESQCGSTLSAINSVITCYPVNGASAYKFKVVTSGTNVTRYYSSTTNSFNLTQVAGSLYNTAYSISVAAKYNGVWGNYGDECTVSTPSPLTKVQSSQCGTSLAALNTFISANYLSYVTNYKFEVVNGATTRTIETVSRMFQLTSLPGGALYNTTYTIRVAAKYNGVWGNYGDVCTVSTPFSSTKVQASQCGTSLAALDTFIYANYLSYATNYKFEVVNGATTQTIETVSRMFQLTSLPGGALYNTTYTIRVAVKYNGVWGNYGDECMVSTPSKKVAKTTDPVTESELIPFIVVGYPNPFTNSIKLDITTQNTASEVEFKVYDMIGKLIETQTKAVSEIRNLELGASYPSGIYNIVVTQGMNLKTVRVVKR